MQVLFKLTLKEEDFQDNLLSKSAADIIDDTCFQWLFYGHFVRVLSVG